jgi:hypothetical protein
MTLSNLNKKEQLAHQALARLITFGLLFSGLGGSIKRRHEKSRVGS